MVENMEKKAERYNPRKGFAKYIVLAIVVVALFVGMSAMVITHENEYTLIKQFGKVEKIIDVAGLSFKIPFVQSTDTLPKSIQLYDLQTSDVITKDKKSMVADCYVLWRITDPKLFVQSLNSLISNAESRINTTVYNSVKSVISSMDQTEVISSRDGALSEIIMNNIGNVMDTYGIEILSVETKHLDLPSDNKAAVYERMISERNNIAAAYTAEGESEAKMIRTATDNEITVSVSEAEAEAERLIAEGEKEYMNILSSVYADESRADFYTFVRALDAAKLSMTGDNKTLILSEDSPIAQVFNTIE